MSAPDPIPTSTVPASAYFNPELCQKAVDVFGDDGAWLLLSQVWYGWRAYYDLACAVRTGNRPETPEDLRPTPIGPEYQVVVDLQVQGFMYAAAEQFATLLLAMRAHERGTSKFFEAYVGAPPTLAKVINGLDGLTKTNLAALVGDPATITPRSTGVWPSLVDPGSVATTDVGGLHVPKSVIESAADQAMIGKADALLVQTIVNIGQLHQFVDPPEPVPGAERQPQALRAVDNSFRHGLRLLFHEACPSDRQFRVGGFVSPPESPSVDLYLPGRGKAATDAINYATVSCTEDRTTDHLESVRQLCARVGQLARAFLGYQTTGTLQHLLVATSLELPVPPGTPPASEPGD